MDYVIKILREVCEGNSTELRALLDTDPEEGVYFVGNYKTHQNDRFTSLAAAKQYQQNLCKMLVSDAHESLKIWYDLYVGLKMSDDEYLKLPSGNCLNEKTFIGSTNSKYGKFSKNINFCDFYNTKKLYSNDSEYVFGLIKVMYERFHIRNSLVGPAFFDHICNMTSYKQIDYSDGNFVTVAQFIYPGTNSVAEVEYAASVKLNTTGPPRQLELYSATAAVKVG